jgi:ParB/RepB/Spo0J family partition protein
MSESQKNSYVRDISPERIQKNPENPRLFFRSDELDSLLVSIKRYGIQVPINVYEDKGEFFLIDGERRWRCAKKLNLKKIPALVQDKPSDLDNLLLMFNIHSLREQWDYLTIANKLPRVISLHAEQHGREPNEIELSELTGLTRGQVRRCRLLLDLPEKYRSLLLEELELPKHRQKLSEDFFIEMEKSLKTVSKRVPSVMTHPDNVRDVLIKKYRAGIINNIVDFRKLSKIATAVEGLGVTETKAKAALKEIFSSNNGVGISSVFEEQFGFIYGKRWLESHIDSMLNYLDDFDEPAEGEDAEDVKQKLRDLRDKINEIVGN